VSSPASNSRDASPQNPSLDLTNSGNPDNANSPSPAEPPLIQINGENPAHVSVGATYQDLGATIVAPGGDKNLGIKTFLNGKLVSNIVLDTSQVATDTIDYVVTDPAGRSATSTRTVIVSAATPPSAPTATSTPAAESSLPIIEALPLVPDYPATTTIPAAASSTAQ
jgi:hypothetical protein